MTTPDQIDDYAQHSIQLEQLHKKLDNHLLHRQYREAFQVTGDMQAALWKLQNWCWRHQGDVITGGE